MLWCKNIEICFFNGFWRFPSLWRHFLNMFAICNLNSVQNHVYTQIRKPNDCSKHREPSKFVCSVFQCVFSIHKMEAIAWRSVSNFVGDAVMRLHFLPIMSKRWLCKRPDWREAQLSSALLSSLCLGSTGSWTCSVLRIWV